MIRTVIDDACARIHFRSVTWDSKLSVAMQNMKSVKNLAVNYKRNPAKILQLLELTAG